MVTNSHHLSLKISYTPIAVKTLVLAGIRGMCQSLRSSNCRYIQYPRLMLLRQKYYCV